MDGFSGAASVITVFGLALSSTREIYNIVSSIRSGPKTVQQMVSTVKDLSNLLQQLTGYTDRFYLAADLEETVSKCARDLEAFKGDLAKLSTTDTNKVVRLWKNVKVILKERDLEMMSARIQQHIIALSLRIQIIEGKRGSSHTLSLERIEASSSTQAVLSEKSSGIQERTNTAVNQVHDSVQALGMAAITSQQKNMLAFEQLSDKIQHMSGSSTGQSENLNATCNAILELLKQHFPGNPVAEDFRQEAFPHHTSEDPGEMQVNEEAQDTSGDDSCLRHALDRLCHLAKEAGKTVHCEEAEKVLSDIQQIFELLLEAEEKKFVKDRKGMRSREDDRSDDVEDQLLYQREVKRIKGFISASQSIAINEKASRPLTLAAAKYKTRNTHYQRPARNGTVTFRARRKYRRFGTTSHDYMQDALTDIPESLEASFTFLPNNAQNPWISVDFKQSMSYEGSFLRRPALSVSAILPKDSEVFRLIAEGDLNGLIRSLSLKRAFLTDRDIDGRCLLNHALYAVQPDICRFLIDEGADVEFFEQPYDSSIDNAMSSLNVSRCNDYIEVPKFFAPANRCTSLLLEAGADPVLSSGWGSFINHLLREGTTEAWKTLLDHGLHYLDLDGDVPAKQWLSFILRRSNWHPEIISLFLCRQGKGGLPIQNLQGCLHEAIHGTAIGCQQEIIETLILLVRGGADVYARDDSGLTVSEIVCCKKTKWYDGSRYWRPRVNRNLRLKKIWINVLSICGYDPEEVISASVRLEQPCNCDTDSVIDSDEHICTAATRYLEGGSDSISDDEEESHVFADDVDNDSTSDQEWESDVSGDDVVTRQPDAVLPHHYESLLLEGDAEVWSS